MELIHNQTFKLIQDTSVSAYPAGIYRVIFDEPVLGKTVCVCLSQTEPRAPLRTGRKKLHNPKTVRKKAPYRLVGELLWMERDELQRLHNERCLLNVDFEREAIYYPSLEPIKDEETYLRRRRAMAGFLDLEKLKEEILINRGLGGLVRQAMAAENVSRAFVYKQWSTLCRLGISEISLLPRRDRCGAPGITRACDPGGRKKSGRKTVKQRIDRAMGIDSEPEQPGMSTEWRAAIMAADKQINTPTKPRMSARYTQILNSAFVKRYRYVGADLVAIDPAQGAYPNPRQVRRVLEVDVPRLARLQQQTTTGHFKRSLRGLLARNWKGVAGPGHTWAIDSTLADIYLRSSINRAWIVGRPIVYIVVDIWSTAIVGFYVCLTGPSWNTAKISLFNSIAAPDLLAELWGYQPILSLNPAPSLCYQLMCDRGEYLSQAASLTAIKLDLDMAYAPPYRPDLKGLVEVLHRIAKDAQYLFLPGAMDARRKEFDMRKSHPDESAMTVPQYYAYLYEIFSMYNLTADRSKRVDAHMAAAGVFPSPAGLWRWGHAMGIGFRRSMLAADMVTSLLPTDTATVRRDGVVFAGNDYQSHIAAKEQWSTTARNFGSWQIPIHFYPGSVSRIWTPNTGVEGLLELQISDQAKTSAEVTFDELTDSIAYSQLQRPDITHTKTLLSLQSWRRLEALKQNAIQLTGEAIQRERGATPTMTEARLMEVAGTTASNGSELRVTEQLRDEALEAHEAMMHSLLHASDEEAMANG